MVQPRPLFHLFSVFSIKTQILQQISVKMSIPVYGAGIRTHDLLIMSLLPRLDQGKLV